MPCFALYAIWRFAAVIGQRGELKVESMSFQRIIYGYMDSPFCHGKEDFYLFHRRNSRHLESLPVQYKDAEDWQTKPVITRGFFAISNQDETHLSQIIHFGGSYKCYIGDTWEKDWSEWLLTFEQILRGMYWYSVTLHVISEGEDDRVCE